jgi:predicted RNase H-like nuclease (RuvC/YqgF family)
MSHFGEFQKEKAMTDLVLDLYAPVLTSAKLEAKARTDREDFDRRMLDPKFAAIVYQTRVENLQRKLDESEAEIADLKSKLKHAEYERQTSFLYKLITGLRGQQ